MEEDHPSCRNSKQPPSPGFNLHWEEARRAPGSGGGWSVLSEARQLCQGGQSGGHLPPPSGRPLPLMCVCPVDTTLKTRLLQAGKFRERYLLLRIANVLKSAL